MTEYGTTQQGGKHLVENPRNLFQRRPFIYSHTTGSLKTRREGSVSPPSDSAKRLKFGRGRNKIAAEYPGDRKGRIGGEGERELVRSLTGGYPPVKQMRLREREGDPSIYFPSSCSGDETAKIEAESFFSLQVTKVFLATEVA